MQQTATVYGPENPGFFNLSHWRVMFMELVHARELIWRLTVREISARYKQSVLGVFWAFLPPVVTTLIFTFLNRAAIFPVSDTVIPYPAYVLLSTTIWQIFASGLTYATRSLVSAGTLITKINFSREALVISALGEAVFELAIRLGLVAVVFIIFGVVPAWQSVFAIIPMAIILILTLGLGFILSMVNGVSRDVGMAIPLLINLLMFVTPVVYPPPTEGPGALVNTLNPLSPLLNAARDLILRGEITNMKGLFVATALACGICLVAWYVFHIAQPKIAERI